MTASEETEKLVDRYVSLSEEYLVSNSWGVENGSRGLVGLARMDTVLHLGAALIDIVVCCPHALSRP